MNESEKAYLAGIIDGEGSIMLIRFHKNQHPAPCVTIASISLELLEWVKDTTKLGIIKSKKNYKPNKHENSFTYVVKHDEAINLLNEVFPYLIIQKKKSRAKLIIEHYKNLTIRNGRYTKEQLFAKNKFYEDFMAI